MASTASSEEVIADELAQVRRERDLYVRLLRLGDERTVERLLREALWLAIDAIGARQGYLELAGAGDGSPSHAIACGLSEAEVARVRAALARGSFAEAVATGATMIAPAAPGAAVSGVRPIRVGASLCTPIGVDPPLGVLYLQSPQHRTQFTATDAATAERVVGHLAALADRLLDRRRSVSPPDMLGVGRGLVGRSVVFRRLLEQLALVAPLDVPVCLTGEPGVGKRRVARAIHEASPRAAGPFLGVACAGAGALGLFAPGGVVESAAGGTLLLEDVDALGPDDQADVARLLTLVRHRLAGLHAAGDPDVRVLVSTTVDLRAAVDAGRFREDLYLVLAVMPLRVPSLAERRGDVAPLAARFLQQACGELGGQPLALSPGAVDALEAAEWRGNLRELGDVVGQGARRSAADGVRQVERAHLFPPPADGTTPERTLQEATRRFQAGLVARVLESTRGDVAAAAKLLDLRHSHLDSLIRFYQLESST